MFATFDTSTASRMFGYRVQFNRGNMEFNQPKPRNNQSFKPIHKFASEVVAELQRNYEAIPNYHTVQRVIIPVADSSSESEDPSADDSDPLAS